MTHLVYVAGWIADDALSALKARHDVVLGYGPAATDLGRIVERVDAILIRTGRLDAAMLSNARRCRIIARRGVGVDNIDVTTATALGIPVAITVNANATTVAEHVFALALAVLHNVVLGDRAVRAARFASRDRLVGYDLSGRRLGLIGVGRIGREVIRIARRGFGMPVIAYDPFSPVDAESDPGIDVAHTLEAVLRGSDIVSVHTPLSDTTRGLLDSAAFRRMKQGAIVINTARGGIVDEHALAAALRDHHLAGAGIDVFATEPPPADHPLFALDNVVVTPHYAGLTTESVERMSWASVNAVIDVLDGATTEDKSSQRDWQIINPEYVYATRTAHR